MRSEERSKKKFKHPPGSRQQGILSAGGPSRCTIFVWEERKGSTEKHKERKKGRKEERKRERERERERERAWLRNRVHLLR